MERWAGEELGFGPLELHEGIGNPADLRELRRSVRLRADRLFQPLSAAMAPERSEPYWSALGAVQPEVTFGV